MNIGNRNTAQRMVNAEAAFIANLMAAGEITKEQAEKVLQAYRRARVVKMDAVVGVISVKHGAFLDRDVIRNAMESLA